MRQSLPSDEDPHGHHARKPTSSDRINRRQISRRSFFAPFTSTNQVSYLLACLPAPMVKPLQKRYYAVLKGHKTGIFASQSVSLCAHKGLICRRAFHASVKGFAGSRSKAFDSKVEAEQWFRFHSGETT